MRQRAGLMGAAYGAGAVLPLLPFLLLPARLALVVAVVLAGVALFGVGVAKSRRTERAWARSGLEVLALGDGCWHRRLALRDGAARPPASGGLGA